jgi:DNA modification methylase
MDNDTTDPPALESITRAVRAWVSREASVGLLHVFPHKNRRSVWAISTNAGRSNGGHEAPYPIELASRCVRASTKHGDVVLDPFCGSGTTGVAALRLRRSFVGIDLDPRSARVAGRRLMHEMRDP